MKAINDKRLTCRRAQLLAIVASNIQHMTRSQPKNQLALFLFAMATVVLLLYLTIRFEVSLLGYLGAHMTERASPETLVRILKLILWATFAYLIVRALRAFLFGLIFRL